MYSIISSTQIEILIPDKLISNGIKGDMKMHTTTQNQLALGASEAGQVVGDIGGGLVGGVLGGALGSLGLDPSTLFSGNTIYIIIAIIVVLCSSSVAAYFI